MSQPTSLPTQHDACADSASIWVSWQSSWLVLHVAHGDGAAPSRLATVRLPAGSRIAAGQGDPLLLATAAPVADAGLVWLELHDLHGQTGLAPILLAYLDGGAGEGRPWDTSELDDRAALSEVARLDPA